MPLSSERVPYEPEKEIDHDTHISIMGWIDDHLEENLELPEIYEVADAFGLGIEHDDQIEKILRTYEVEDNG